MHEDVSHSVAQFYKLNPRFQAVCSKKGDTTWYRLHEIVEDPWKAWGSCDGVSIAFSKFLFDNRRSYYFNRVTYHDSVNNLLFESMAYRKHIEDETQHAFVELGIDEETYIVDWSAGQFGYKDFPLIWKQTKRGKWKRVKDD